MNVISFNSIVKKVFAFLILSLFISVVCLGQGFCNAKLYSQSDVDNYKTLYPDCSYPWKLEITGSDITNLDSLSSIVKCDKIEIFGTSLSNLSGLENIDTVYSYWLNDSGIFIYDNPLLENLDGLHNVTLTSNVTIGNNNMLTTTAGLSPLEFKKTEFNNQGSTIIIENNEVLNEANSFDSLFWASNIIIVNNPLLESLNTFKNVELISSRDSGDCSKGCVVINENNSLVSLDELNLITKDSIIIKNNQNLQKISDGIFKAFYVEISSNDNLQSLGNLLVDFDADYCNWRIDGLKLDGNPKLTSLENFQLLSKYELLDLQITNNEELEFCSYGQFCHFLQFYTDNIHISDNHVGCNSAFEILENCDLFANNFSGRTYIDMDCDSVFGPSDIGLSNILINHAESEHLLANSMTDGLYEVNDYFTSDLDELVIQAKPAYGFSFLPESYVLDEVGTNLHTFDFSTCPDSIFLDSNAKIMSFRDPSPGFSRIYKVCVTNTGLIQDEGELLFNFSNHPDAELYVNYEDVDDAIVDGLNLRWNINALSPFERSCYWFTVNLDPNSPLGTELFPYAEFTSTATEMDINLDNNVYSFSQEVIGSFDPNDKHVIPSSIDFENIENANNYEYLIRFQNTGTAPAQKVVIIDEFIDHLDIQSFRMIDASHEYSIKFIGNNTIVWELDDIQLPAEQMDPDGSNGFVKFSISSESGLDEDDTIKNKAAIYFDFNEPITTEYAIVEINYTDTHVDDTGQDDLIYVYPNPSKEYFQIDVQDVGSKLISIDAYSISGRKMQSAIMRDSGLLHVNCKNWMSGLYVLKIQLNSGSIYKRVLKL